MALGCDGNVLSQHQAPPDNSQVQHEVERSIEISERYCKKAESLKCQSRSGRLIDKDTLSAAEHRPNFSGRLAV